MSTGDGKKFKVSFIFLLSGECEAVCRSEISSVQQPFLTPHILGSICEERGVSSYEELDSCNKMAYSSSFKQLSSFLNLKVLAFGNWTDFLADPLALFFLMTLVRSVLSVLWREFW